MNWAELRKIAMDHGFEFYKHGGNHDLYISKKTQKIILIERHWSQEIRTGLMHKLKKDIGF